jgi:hypothetical protein
MEGRGSGDTDLCEKTGDCLAFWGVAKGLEDPSEPQREKGAALFCLFFAGEKGLDAEVVSVLTARDLGIIDVDISESWIPERGGVEGGRCEFSGSDLVAFPSLESLL